MTAPATQDTAPSAPSLSDSLSQMMGGLPDYDGESPGPDETSAAGTTPAEPTPGTDPDAAPPPAGDAGAESEGTTPDTPTPDDSDPFADTTPASFQVNGKAVTNEDIRIFKEGGAVIRPEALPNVLQKLSERESLQGRLHTQSQEYQTLAKAVEWTDPTSKKTYSGPEAAVEMRVGNASLLAENRLLVSTFLGSDTDLKPFLTTVKGPNGEDRIVVAPDAIAYLQRENALTQREAANAIRDHFKTALTPAPVAPTVDYQAEAPALIQQVAQASKLDAAVLTDADKSILAKQLAFHTRDGKVSPEWQELVKDRIQLRTETKAAVKSTADATARAAKDGAARLAAAARGVRQPVKPAAPATPTRKTTQAEERQDHESTWMNSMISSGANAMRQR